MDSQYKAQEVEDAIYKAWEKQGLFNPDNLKSAKKPYSIAVPPPNITGSLHMGHALNDTIQDILIRWQRMKGMKAVWLPGMDHAGIATQNVVEKELKKQGQTRFDLGREEFLKKIWEWKEKYGGQILNQMKRLGASCDWSKLRFTMDEKYSEAVIKSFLHYHDNGWVYRTERVVNWCPRCKTSLSDLELEYKEQKTNLWYIKYPLSDKGGHIVVATTRPETMLGDTAVAVNPKDERYKKLIGQFVDLPLTKRRIPIIAYSLIDKDFGTGAVKVTPSHSFDDYQISQKHKLEMITVIDENSRMNQNCPAQYQGLKIDEARTKIVEDLTSQGLIEKIEEYSNKVPKCYRCDSTVESLPSKQWFVKMEHLAKVAIKAVESGKVKFHPKKWEKTYLTWLKNTRDWCISRQLWWGHRIPAYFCEKSEEKYIVSSTPPKKCPFCGECSMKQSDDVFDTWFSSALWPFTILGWPNQTKDLKTFYPTNVLITDRDIINLWVSRMVFSGIELTGEIPFTDVLIHATVLTKDGRRMSKSLGTGIDPIDLLNQFGADATRFGLAWQASGGQDMRFDESKIWAGKKFCNKIWNASRFVLSMTNSKQKFQGNKKPKPITREDKKILEKLEKIIISTNKSIEQYKFGQALQKIYGFFWHDFCDKYIETAKKQIKEPKNKKEPESTQQILGYTLINSLKLLHPFLPFITEEIYQKLPTDKKEKYLITSKWPGK